jgi:hypothetical protein
VEEVSVRMESLMEPKPEELYGDEVKEKGEDMFFADQIKEAWELTTEEIQRILSGIDPVGLHDKADLQEVLMRRRMAALQPSSYIVITSVLLLLVLFGKSRERDFYCLKGYSIP